MIKEEATPLVVDLAKGLVSLVRDVAPDWRKAFLRICVRDAVSEAKASYVHERGVDIVDVLKHKDFFHAVTAQGRALLAILDKPEGLFLLVVDSALDYEIKFEHKDMRKWAISKMRGGTGVPEGLDR
jgi:hypothetical protein